MLAFAYAATFGLIVGMRPTALRLIFGVWAILVTAIAALLFAQVDLAGWAVNLGLALLGYNAVLAVCIVRAIYRTSAA